MPKTEAEKAFLLANKQMRTQIRQQHEHEKRWLITALGSLVNK